MAKKKSNNEDRLKKMNSGERYNTGLTQRFNVLGPELATQKKNNKNSKLNAHSSVKNVAKDVIRSGVGDKKVNNSSALERAYRRYEAFTTGRDFGEINSYYNKTGKSAYSIENGRFVRNPSFRRDVDYNQYNRSPYRPMEKWERNEDNYWGYGTFDKWVKGKNTPKYSDTNYWAEGTPQSDMWHSFHDYRDPNWERDEKIYQSLEGEEKEKWAMHNASHFKLYENEGAFRKDKTNEIRKAEQRFLFGQASKDQYKDDPENLATHHTKRNAIDKLFGMISNNTAAQVAYAHATGGSKLQAFKDSLKYMNPFNNDVSGRKYWSDVFEANTENLKKKGGTIAFSPSGSPFAPIKTMTAEEVSKDKFTNALGGLLMDVLTDPLTYAGGGGLEVGAKFLKGTGATRAELNAMRSIKSSSGAFSKTEYADDLARIREAKISKAKQDSVDTLANQMQRERRKSQEIDMDLLTRNLSFNDARDIVLESNPSLKNTPDRLTEMTYEFLQNYGRNIMGYRGVNEGNGLKLFGKELVSAKKIREAGDKTVAPLFNVANRKLRSTLGLAFSDKNKVLRLANQKGDAHTFSAVYADLLSHDYGIADKNVRAGRVADKIDEYFANASDEEIMDFIQQHDKGTYRNYTDNKISLDKARKAAAQKIKDANPDLIKAIDDNISYKQSLGELLENVASRGKTELQSKRFKKMSDVINRREFQLQRLTELSNAGIDIPGIKDLQNQLKFIKENEDLFTRHYKDIYQIYGKPITGLSFDDALSARGVMQDLDSIAELNGGTVPWSDIVSDYFATLGPEQTNKAEAFRSAIAKHNGSTNLSDFIGHGISADDFAESIRYTRDKLIDRQLDALGKSGYVDTLRAISPREATNLPETEKTIWNMLRRDSGSLGDAVKGDFGNVFRSWEQRGSIMLDGEKATDLSFINKTGEILDTMGTKSPKDFAADIEELKKLSDEVSAVNFSDADDIVARLEGINESRQFYDVDNIAKSLNKKDLQSLYSSLDEQALDLNQQLGGAILTEMESLMIDELRNTTALNSTQINELLKLASDEDLLQVHKLWADNMAKIAREEKAFGRLEEAAQIKLFNRYVPREISDNAKDFWEKLFGTPFEEYLKTPGKFNPLHGEQMTYNQHRTFRTMADGERWYKQQVEKKVMADIIEEHAAEFKKLHGDAEFKKIYGDAEMNPDVLEKYLKTKYADRIKEFTDAAGNLYNYSIAEIFMNRAVGHNQLMQSDAINNLVKSRLTTVFDGTKTSDKIVIPYIDMMEDCRKMAGLEGVPFATAEAMFEDIVSSVGIDPRLVGKNISHFEVNESQLERIKDALAKYASDANTDRKIELITEGYNMDKPVYNMLNRYTKAQMQIMQNQLLNLYDSFITKFKILNTIINPGFHGQNAPSNVFQSFLGIGMDAFNVKRIKKAADIIRTGDPKQTITLNGKTYTYREMRRILMEYNVVDNTFFNDFRKVGENLSEAQMMEMSMEDFNNFFKNDFDGGLSFLNPISDVLNVPFKKMGNIGASIEGTQRANLFMSCLDQGYDFREAVEKVNEFLFDYGDLTRQEQQIFKRIIPFYSFLRKNVPMELKMMLEQPQKFVNTRRVFDTVSRMSEDYVPQDERGQWRDTDIQIPFRINGQYYGISDNMPYTQFEKWTDINKVVGQTSPLVKLPIEALTGKYSYTGMDIDSPLEYGMNQIPLTKNLLRLKDDNSFGYAPDDADPDYEPNITERNLYYLGQTIGFPINPINRTTYYKDYDDYWEQYENEPNVLQNLISAIRERGGK